MRTTVVDGQDLDILMVPAPVDLLVFDPHIREMDLFIEVRQVVFEGPLLNLPVIAIRVSVVVVAIPIVFMELLLVLALELVVEEHALDMGIALGQALGDAQVGVIDLCVMFELALSFEAGVELLARVVAAVSV